MIGTFVDNGKREYGPMSPKPMGPDLFVFGAFDNSGPSHYTKYFKMRAVDHKGRLLESRYTTDSTVKLLGINFLTESVWNNAGRSSYRNFYNAKITFTYKRGCVKGSWLGGKKRGHTRETCAKACIDWGPECVGFEWYTEKVGTAYVRGDCMLRSSSDTVGCDNLIWKVDFFEQVGSQYYEDVTDMEE